MPTCTSPTAGKVKVLSHVMCFDLNEDERLTEMSMKILKENFQLFKVFLTEIDRLFCTKLRFYRFSMYSRLTFYIYSVVNFVYHEIFRKIRHIFQLLHSQIRHSTFPPKFVSANQRARYKMTGSLCGASSCIIALKNT